MKTKSKITALMIVVLTLLTQIPFSVFASTENTLTPDTLPSGRAWNEYSRELEFIGETFSPYFSIADGGMLPPGLSLTDTHTCHPSIEGTPTKAGLYTFTILAKNGYDKTLLEKTYTMTILPDYPLNFIDGCTVILVLYKEDSDGNSQPVECQTAEYSGSEKTFTTTATDYTLAKVMVWKDLTTIKPVTEVEIVNFGEGD